MATSWAKIAAAAMVYIDDVRLNEQLNISPALFYRRMSLYTDTAMSMLQRPPELLQYLREGRVDPVYDEYEWTSTAESTMSSVTVDTGKIGFDLCSCVMVEHLDDGRTLQTPCDVEYDAETGEVTFAAQEATGITYSLDFYTDGAFNDLTALQIRLFALAIYDVWDKRFAGDWLNRQPKINDPSYSTPNEGNWTEKQSQAHRREAQDFYDELKAYEQMCAYESVVTRSQKGAVILV